MKSVGLKPLGVRIPRPPPLFPCIDLLGASVSRVVLQQGEQRRFLDSVHLAGFDWGEIATISGVSPRTLRDWRTEQFRMTYEAIDRLHRSSGVPLPTLVRVLPEHWSTSIAGKAGGNAYVRLYGNPGTPDGRRRGGFNSQAQRSKNLQLYGSSGFKVRKKIIRPGFCGLLAEFVGIVLGDGSIQRYQVSIALNRETDAEYCKFISRSVYDLFGIRPSLQFRKRDKVCCVVISASNLVDYLCEMGLRIGNKVDQQVDIPSWIFHNTQYMRSCVRGLIDTDGCALSYEHTVNGRVYHHFRITYTSHSRPLLASVKRILDSLGFNPKVCQEKRLHLHRAGEVARYFREIGTSNPKHLQRYETFIRQD